jgi:hypothetical protein
MTAADLLARCCAAGIDLAAGPDGSLTWEADADPSAELLAALAEHKKEVLNLLVAQLPVSPPPGARLYCSDNHGRPCDPANAYQWTWEGGTRWFYAAADPIPTTLRWK